MTDDHTPSAPAASEAGAVIASLSADDASAVLESLSSPAPAASTSGADGSDFSSALEQALEGADLTKMTDAQVADFESGDPGRVESALAAQLTPRAPGEEIAGAPARISIKALKPEDRARTVQALDLIRAGSTPAEAFAAVFGITEQAQPHTTEAPGLGQDGAADLHTAPEFSAPYATAPQVAELEQHLAELQQHYKEAREAYDPAATDLLEQMTDVKIDLREARREATVVHQEWQGGQAGSHSRAMDQFSELITDADSGFIPHCDDEILLAEAKKDPILSYPDWPEKIGRRVIDKFFNGHAAHSPNPARGSSLVPPAPRHALRLPGSPVGHGFSAGALSPQTAMAEIDKLTPEQQDAFIHSLDRLTSAKSRR